MVPAATLIRNACICLLSLAVTLNDISAGHQVGRQQGVGMAAWTGVAGSSPQMEQLLSSRYEAQLRLAPLSEM